MVDKMIKVPVLDAAVHSACCFTYFFYHTMQLC